MEAPRFASGLYVGSVMHHRVKPVRHRLSYRVFSLLADLDELPRLDRELRLFAHNHFGLIGFRDRDFGPLGGESPLPGGEREIRDLKSWAEGQLAAAGIEGGGPVRLLCFPRVLGFVFNPISVWYAHRADGRLSGVIYEVTSTFGERRSYVLPTHGEDRFRHGCDKTLHVSPFMRMDMSYAFRGRDPGERMRLAIDGHDPDGLLIATAQGSVDANGVFAAMIVVAAVALMAEWLLTMVENRLLTWRPSSAAVNE